MQSKYNVLSDKIKSSWYNSIFELTSELIESSHRFYTCNGIKPVLMPITCGSVSSPMGLGSDSLPVKVKLFDEDTYLADSMQFQLECMLRYGGQGVWYIMPTFRGEDPDKTHLNQFFHSEAEIMGDLDDVINFAGQYVHSITKDVFYNKREILEGCSVDLSHVESLLSFNGNFPRINYQDAIKLLGKNEKYFDEIDDGVFSITRLGEQELISHFNGVVWLTNSYSDAVPFYQAREGKFAKNADLLFGVGEVLGCGERNVTSTETINSLEDHNVNKEEYMWYIAMKEKFPLLTSGFGMGIERYLLWLLRHDDIRDIHVMSRLKGEDYLF